MRIKTQYGSDTGMSLAYIFLETAQEEGLATEALRAELQRHLADRGMALEAIVDCFLMRRDALGSWVSAGILG